MLKKIIIITLCLGFLISGFSYYINSNEYYLNNMASDGYSGFGHSRDSNSFIADGCGINTSLDVVTGLCWDIDFTRAATKQWSTNTAYTEPSWNTSSKSYIWPGGRVDTDYPAFNYCDDLVLGDQTDWRLPDVSELMTLQSDISNTCTDLVSFGF
ncbi:MAG: hypothetical protein KC550_07425, partial [Nanoarchaeota archaeon]|nr:hypothetical protein [Nanoarchaeota archaeon]